MFILALVAGTNDPSNSDTLADAFLEGVGSVPEVRTEKIRLRDYPLPHFTLDCYKDACPLPDEYQGLRTKFLEADGILIATPIWNFGVPAHLKNVIDWIGCFGLDKETKSKGMLRGKPFFFVFTGGAPKAAWKGLMRFTTMFVPEGLRYFGATIAGKDYEGHCTLGRGKFGRVVHERPDTLRRLRRKGERFARFCERFHATGRLPLRHRLIERAYKAGQRIVSKF